MVESAKSRLAAAEKKGNPWEEGYSLLEAADALLQNVPDPAGFQVNAKIALLDVDQAIEAFSSIPFPGGIANAHLAQASIYTQLAEFEQEAEKKAARVDQAFTACLAAQDVLENEGVDYRQIFDVYSLVNLLLLRIRELIQETEFQEHLEDLIQANGSMIGEIIAENIQMRDEGGSMLLAAQMLELMAELEDDSSEKEEILETAGMLALQAGRWLDGTGDDIQIERALEMSQRTRVALDKGINQKICSQCGSDNPTHAKFCNQCGSPLEEGS